ncbi:MAG: hypothetical protein KA788_00430 [Lacunisphaera sp.]|nr:hypothetical protein [Lacunisphaera sp.]
MPHYPFGEKSAALLGLHLKPDGRMAVFAYRRPQNRPQAAMEPLYRHDLAPVTGATKAGFRLHIAADAVGLFTVEYSSWRRIYPDYVVELLGMSVPFGTDDIPYNQPEFGGGTNRRHDISANREIDGVFLTENTVAELILSDVQSRGLTEKRYKLPQDSGDLLLTLRVDADNYRDGCAAVEFTSGHSVLVGNKTQTRLVLNTTPNPASLS